MYRRSERGDFIWVFPLLAGFCATIAILTPTASYSMMGVSWSWWMWDYSLMTYLGYPPVSFFVNELDFIIPSIITTIAILLCAVNLFTLAGTSRKNRLDTNGFVVISLLSALLSIGVMIYYAFSVAFAFNDGLTVKTSTFPPGYHFWSEFTPSFGLILPYVSAIFSFIGLGLFRHYSKQRGIIVPRKTVTPSESYIVPPKYEISPPKYEVLRPKYEVAKKPATVSVTTGALNFCPECGHKLERSDINFCTKCGFKL